MDPAARIVIDFTALSTPIEGSLRGDAGQVLNFAGYMQLVTAIETALQDARERIGDAQVSVGVDLPLPPTSKERE